jgi:hypothetical protein
MLSRNLECDFEVWQSLRMLFSLSKEMEKIKDLDISDPRPNVKNNVQNLKAFQDNVHKFESVRIAVTYAERSGGRDKRHFNFSPNKMPPGSSWQYRAWHVATTAHRARSRQCRHT